MPTVPRVGSYRFFFHSADADEPHVHVERDDNVAKFWIDPVRLASSGGFRRPELWEMERLVGENASLCWRHGVAFTTVDTRLRAVAVAISHDALTVDLSDGRTVAIPLSWYPRPGHGTDAERRNWRMIAGGEGIHWPDLDEDVSVASLLTGKASAESQSSLQNWLRIRDGARTASKSV